MRSLTSAIELLVTRVRKLLPAAAALLLCLGGPALAQPNADPASARAALAAVPDDSTLSQGQLLTRVLQLTSIDSLAALADSGDVRAQLLAADHYSGLSDYPRAARYYQLAADGGSKLAPFYIGAFYLEGMGVTRDHARAAHYMQMGEQREDGLATLWLGHMYERGEHFQQNYAEAARLFTLASTRGSAQRSGADAMRALAQLQARGQGVQRDGEIAAQSLERIPDNLRTADDINNIIAYRQQGERDHAAWLAERAREQAEGQAAWEANERRLDNDTARVASALGGALEAIANNQQQSSQAQAAPPVVASTSGGASALPPLTTGSAAGNGQPDASRSRLIHNPAQSATECVQLVQESSRGGADLSGGQRLVNRCGITVEVFWCFVGRECESNSGNSWTLGASGAGSSWPIARGEVRYGACRGANSGGFDTGSQGQRSLCPNRD